MFAVECLISCRTPCLLHHNAQECTAVAPWRTESADFLTRRAVNLTGQAEFTHVFCIYTALYTFIYCNELIPMVVQLMRQDKMGIPQPAHYKNFPNSWVHPSELMFFSQTFLKLIKV